MVYLIFVSSNNEAIKKFVESFKSDKQPKVIKNISKFKKEDIIPLLDVLKVEGEGFSIPSLKRVDQVMVYVTMLIMGLTIAHLIYFYIGLLDNSEILNVLAKSKEEINKIADELITELVSSVFISALISLVATPAAALAIQLKRAYKVKKISSRISKLIGLRSKIYKILKSKPAKLLLRISDKNLMIRLLVN